jgi:hypothetical protein
MQHDKSFFDEPRLKVHPGRCQCTELLTMCLGGGGGGGRTSLRILDSRG